MKASTIATVGFWALPVAFLNFWTFGRVAAYFLHNAEWNKADFKATVLPLDIPAAIEATFYEQIDTFFNLKLFFIRLHIAVAAIMGLICMLLLLPIFPKGSKLHRKLGWVHATLLVPFSLEMAYTLFYGIQTNVGITPFFGNVISLVIMVATMPLAIYYARHHRIRAHRTCMLLHAAALYINPAQRFFWAMFAKSNFGAPYADYEDWCAKPVRLSEFAAFGACFTTALAYIAMGPAPKTTKAKKAL